MSKKKTGSGGIIYSTDPGFRMEEDAPAEETLPAKQQRLRVILDTRQRAGKAVTLVTGFAGKKDDLEDLGKKLKTHCGTGGSVKDGEIIVQGDQRDKITQWLLKNGYTSTKRI
ncbi:translation initiation factor [Puia sp. P3]|uniref:translation initiation factor n=1 Tax=Puia sp. P3 TaxID=3423952 RepID=UPI003D679B85